MTDSLEVTDHLDGDRFRLQWWCSDDEDFGAVVGEGGKKPKPGEGGDIEWYTAEKFCWDLLSEHPDSDSFGRDMKGFWWISKGSAAAALAKIRSEIKAAKRRPTKSWPDWAIKASAAGWKPPKNWKP